MPEKYQHLVVCFEHDDGKPLNVSFEMLGEARRLMDDYNKLNPQRFTDAYNTELAKVKSELDKAAK